MTAKQWLKLYLILLSVPLLCISFIVPVIDPYFHYHKPLTDYFFYELNAERYQNHGITRNFDYDVLITGTSMTENFKTSEFDNLFGCKSIKVPFSGGTFFEINSNQKAAFENHTVKYMIRALDYNELGANKNKLRSDSVYPIYLYNTFLPDDINYIWNIDALLRALHIATNGLKGKSGITSFDDYANWNSSYTFGKQEVLKNRTEFHSPRKMKSLNSENFRITKENILQNVVELAQEHAECEFYYFFPPYSVADWGQVYEQGALEKRLQEEALAIDIILQCDNIHLFSFNTRHDWILNLDNYKDAAHYGEWINSEMLRLMKNDEYRITKENAARYLQEERDFFTNFDYNSIFAD